MAKIGSLTETNEQLHDDVISKTGLDNYMIIKPLSITKAKQIVSVKKANATEEYMGNCPDTVFVYSYEAALDRLNEKTKTLLINDAVSTINYDTEKDKISVGVPMICVTLDGWRKHGVDLINAAEAGIMAIQQIEEEEKERKEAERVIKRASKKKQ